MPGLQLRTYFNNHSLWTITELRKLCNSFGIIPVCSRTGLMDDMKFYFGEDRRRQARFADGVVRIFEIKRDITIRRQVFGKRMVCPWKY